MWDLSIRMHLFENILKCLANNFRVNGWAWSLLRVHPCSVECPAVPNTGKTRLLCSFNSFHDFHHESSRSCHDEAADGLIVQMQNVHTIDWENKLAHLQGEEGQVTSSWCFMETSAHDWVEPEACNTNHLLQNLANPEALPLHKQQ